MANEFHVRKIVRGSVVGNAIVCPGSFSFLGDVDMGNGEIIASDNPNKGISLRDKVLIYNETKGSSGGMVVLMTLKKKGIAPSAIVTQKVVDYNLAEGAILTQIPFACEPDGNILGEINTGDLVELDTDAGILRKVLIK